MIDKIQHLGYASFLIQGPPLIYIDPWRIVKGVFHADAILISHNHYAHCSPADVDKLRGVDTLVIGNEAVAQELEDVTILRPLQSIQVDRAGIKAIPAYSPGDFRHPKEQGGLGFVISVNYYDIYYAGNTLMIPEMDLIRPDIAILPINGEGTLSSEDAVELIKQMHPRWVIPSHWRSIEEAERFKAQVAGRAEVVIPSRLSS